MEPQQVAENVKARIAIIENAEIASQIRITCAGEERERGLVAIDKSITDESFHQTGAKMDIGAGKEQARQRGTGTHFQELTVSKKLPSLIAKVSTEHNGDVSQMPEKLGESDVG